MQDHSLFHRDTSCLVVIDVQQYFLNKLPAGLAAPLVARIGWFMRVARALGIPIIATAEDIPDNGTLVAPLLDLLPQRTPIFNKMVFGLYDQADIRAAVTASGRTSSCRAPYGLPPGGGARPRILKSWRR